MRKCFIKLYVWRVYLYGCETWMLNKIEQRIFGSFEMWCMKKVLRVSWIKHRTILSEEREILKTTKQDNGTFLFIYIFENKKVLKYLLYC